MVGVPSNSDAVNTIKKQIGNPARKCNTKAWRTALNHTVIEDFRWHNLRHTWASWHVQNGTPLHVLQELGGWSDIKMVMQYAHLAPEHQAEYADNTSHSGAVCKSISTFPGTPNNGNKKSVTEKLSN